jgi:hypothetical protein
MAIHFSPQAAYAARLATALGGTFSLARRGSAPANTDTDSQLSRLIAVVVDPAIKIPA